MTEEFEVQIEPITLTQKKTNYRRPMANITNVDRGPFHDATFDTFRANYSIIHSATKL